jgi:hypothetical protein
MNHPSDHCNSPALSETGRKLKKVRANSRWNGLSFEQCELVEQWLCEENLSHEAIAQRVRQEFGVEVSRWSVGRFYRHRARVRQSLELLEAQVAADELSAIPARIGEMRETAVKLLAKSAVKLGTEKPEDLKELALLTRLLLMGEENEIRLRRVKLEERYYELEANTACATELEKVRNYLRTVGDNEYLTDDEKQRRVAELLFGREKIREEEMDAPNKSGPGLTKDGGAAAAVPDAAGLGGKGPSED